jgi:hypothetical protein
MATPPHSLTLAIESVHARVFSTPPTKVRTEVGRHKSRGRSGGRTRARRSSQVSSSPGAGRGPHPRPGPTSSARDVGTAAGPGGLSESRRRDADSRRSRGKLASSRSITLHERFADPPGCQRERCTRRDRRQATRFGARHGAQGDPATRARDFPRSKHPLRSLSRRCQPCYRRPPDPSAALGSSPRTTSPRKPRKFVRLPSLRTAASGSGLVPSRTCQEGVKVPECSRVCWG